MTRRMLHRLRLAAAGALYSWAQAAGKCGQALNRLAWMLDGLGDAVLPPKPTYVVAFMMGQDTGEPGHSEPHTEAGG